MGLGRPRGRSVRFAAASWEPWTRRAVATSTSATPRTGATRGAGVGGSGKRLLLRNEGRGDRRPAPGATARGSRGAQVREAVARCRRRSGRTERCGAKLCAAGGGGEGRGGRDGGARGGDGATGAREPRGAPGRRQVRARRAPGSSRPGAPRPPRQRRALTFQLRRRSSSLQEPGTSAPKGRRCGTGANWPKCGNRAAARPSLPTRPLPRRGSPTTLVAAAARLYPVPIVPPPPRPASTRTQPRSHSDCSEAAAPPPARPPARPASAGTRERQHAAVPRQAARPPHWAEGEGRPSPLARPSY